MAGIHDIGNKLVSYPECPDLKSFCQKPMLLEWLISVQNVLIWEVSPGFNYRHTQLCSNPECPELEKKRRRRRSSAWFHKETREVLFFFPQQMIFGVIFHSLLVWQDLLQEAKKQKSEKLDHWDWIELLEQQQHHHHSRYNGFFPNGFCCNGVLLKWILLQWVLVWNGFWCNEILLQMGCSCCNEFYCEMGCCCC